MRRMFYALPVIGSVLLSADTQTMYGLVDLTDANVTQQLQVIGKANIKGSTLTQMLNVWGTLSADHTSFRQGIDVKGNEIELKDSVVEGNISVSNYIAKPRVKLDSSIVNGEIVFKSLKKGEVIKDANSQIQGGVKNGEIHE